MTVEEGTITYRKLTVDKAIVKDVASALGFNERGNDWYVYRIPLLSIEDKKIFEDAHMQVYLPTYTVTTTIQGKKTTKELPKILNYLFVLATLEQIRELGEMKEINPVYRHRCKDEIVHENNRWLTVPNEQMHSLMLVAENYEKEVEFCTPNDQRLEKGDRIRIVAGPYQGLEGILVTNQGCKNGGKVCIQITNQLCAFTTQVPDRHIQVLEFSRNTNHLSRKIQAFEKQLNLIMTHQEEYKTLESEQRAALQFFLFRYSELGGLTHLNLTKMTTCRYVAMMLLNRRNEASQCLEQYKTRIDNDKNSRIAIQRWPSAKKYMDTWIQRVDSLCS